jgi:hypothetical protein
MEPAGLGALAVELALVLARHYARRVGKPRHLAISETLLANFD